MLGSIVIDQTDLFCDVDSEIIRPEELMGMTNASNYFLVDFTHIVIVFPYTQESIMREATFKVGSY